MVVITYPFLEKFLLYAFFLNSQLLLPQLGYFIGFPILLLLRNPYSSFFLGRRWFGGGFGYWIFFPQFLISSIKGSGEILDFLLGFLNSLFFFFFNPDPFFGQVAPIRVKGLTSSWLFWGKAFWNPGHFSILTKFFHSKNWGYFLGPSYL